MTEQSIQSHIVTLIHKLEEESIKDDQDLQHRPSNHKTELRGLQLWRAVISECLATFLLVVLVCGASSSHGSAGSPPAAVLLSSSLAAAMAAATLTHCFRHISGAHMNPAVTVAMAITRKISPVRTALFLAAQSGGGVAGAALLYGITASGYQSGLQVLVSQGGTAWERFGLEFVLTFVVVFTYCVSSEKVSPSPAIAMGAAYGACSLVSMPQLNPARALGPAFVLNRWDGLWVIWAAGIGGGAAAALLHALVFSNRKNDKLRSHRDADGDSSAAHSDDDNYDDLDKPHQPQQARRHGGPTSQYPPHPAYTTYRPTTVPMPTGIAAYCPTLGDSGLYPSAVSSSKLEQVESLYGGTRSLYCKSPTLSRGNLHRSQSVYSKPPRAGPLIPAPHPHTHNHNHTHNTMGNAHAQNAHNQMQAREENKVIRTRPDTVYGMVVNQPRRNHSTQSDDSSYGSYRAAAPLPSTTSSGNQNQQIMPTYHIPPPLQY